MLAYISNIQFLLDEDLQISTAQAVCRQRVDRACSEQTQQNYASKIWKKFWFGFGGTD